MSQLSAARCLHHDTQSGQIKAEPECGGQLSLTDLMRPGGEGVLHRWPVSRAVNS